MGRTRGAAEFVRLLAPGALGEWPEARPGSCIEIAFSGGEIVRVPSGADAATLGLILEWFASRDRAARDESTSRAARAASNFRPARPEDRLC